MRKTILMIFVTFAGIAKVYTQQLNDSAYALCKVNEPVEIINDNISVEMVGVKLDLMRFIIRREARMVIMDNKGIAELNKLLIPEPFDPCFVQHAPSIWLHTRMFDRVRIDSLAAWKSNNGTLERIVCKKKRFTEKVINEKERYGVIDGYRLKIEGIGAGDTITLYYSASFPFRENWPYLFSTRMFHHSEWPRKNYELNWKFNSRIDLDTAFYKARPYITVDKGIVNMNWKFVNLPGALNEPGAYSYEDLPWFIFTPKPAELLVEQYTTNKDEYIPAWMIMSEKKENKALNALFSVLEDVRTSDLLIFKHMVDSMKQKFPDDLSGRKTISWFQKMMVEEVRYDPDTKFYNNEVNYLKDKPGADLAGKLLRDRNQITTYSQVINRLGFNFLLAYPTDVRIGRTSSAYFSSIYNQDNLLLTMMRDSSLVWIYPKSDLADYYADELPFYFENTSVMLQNYTQHRGYKRDMNTREMFYVTTFSKPSDNYRKVNSMVNVSLAESKASFQTRISLSGQYSTMTRNIYHGRPADSTINPLYYQKVSDIDLNMKVLKTSPGPVADYFPFLTSVTSAYEMPLPAFNGDTLTLDLTGWFKHIVVGGLSDNPRFTAFHADFMGSDTWSYMIRFDSPVSIVNTPAPVDISTDYGQYTWSVKQVAPDQVLVTSYLLTKAPFVTAQKIDHVSRLYDAVLQRPSHTLKLVRAAN